MSGVKSLVSLAAVALLAVAPAFASDFDNPASKDTSQQFDPVNPQRFDKPDDPEYDNAEPDSADRSSSNLYDERYDLFGFPSALTRNSATYREGPHSGKPQVSGFNAAGAWKATRGRWDVSVAIMDTGIRWNNEGLRTKVFLNQAELPMPQGATTYDVNGNGHLDVDDYASDPRVIAQYAEDQKAPTGRDVIHAFSDRSDADANGYVDDIAGWDFFNDDNDPSDDSSYFASKNHGTGRTTEAVEQGNDKEGSIGVCPNCSYVPLRIYDVFVSDANTVGLAMLYAADNGIEVLEASNASLYHSRFAEAASNYAWRKGVPQLYSGDDLNTGNHTYPAQYDHAMLVHGVVPDTIGLGSDASELGFTALPLASGVPVRTYFRGANTTQFGGKSSISTVGSTGSQATGKSSGVAALVISAAREKGVELTADELRTILEQTAEDVLPGNTGGTGVADPAQPGWDEHFGYGRVDLGKAVSVAQREPAALPPEAYIGTRDWYAPITGDRLRLRGRLRARRAPGGAFHYKVEWAPGLSSPVDWRTVKEADATGTVTDLGTLDMVQVRRAVAAHEVPNDPAGPTFAPGSPHPYQQSFTLRVTATAEGAAVPGQDRKVLTAIDDPTLRKGFPRNLGTGGEAPLRYADLDGNGVQELVVPDEDGRVNAYLPNGRQLKGWPVRTQEQATSRRHHKAPGLRAIAPPREPLRGAAVADLDGDGTQEIVDTAGERVYVWDPNGRLRKGFPKRINPGFCRGEDQSQPLHHRKCGFLASPALARLHGPGKPLSIVVAALDGHLYAIDHRGRAVEGFPLDLVDPEVPEADRMFAESISGAAVGDLTGDGIDDIVVSTNEVYDAEDPGDLSGGLAQGFADVLGNALGGSSRVYAVDGKTAEFLPGWPIHLNGAIQATLPLIGPGHDAALVKLGKTQAVVVSTTGGSLALYGTDGKLIRAAQQNAFGPLSDVTDRSGAVLNLFEYASVGDIDASGGPDLVKYGLTFGQLANLALTGQNFPYNHTIGAFDAASGAPLNAWPRVTDDYQFLSSSTIAKVDPKSDAQQVVAGTGLGLLHAYDGVTGKDAPGFPKQTGGWLFAPAALSDDGRIAGITREGFVFEWDVKAPACQTEWPSFRHDPRQTGDYDADGTPPGPPRGLRVSRGKVTFRAPGDDGRCGAAQRFVLRGARAVKPVAAGERVSTTLRPGARTVRVGAVDEAGNVGPFVTRRVRATRRPSGCGAITRPAAGITRSGARITGRARSRCGIQRVDVAVARNVGRRCAFLRRSGRLAAPRRCLPPRYLRATGRRRWRLRVTAPLPPGRYVVRSRALDRHGRPGVRSVRRVRVR